MRHQLFFLLLGILVPLNLRGQNQDVYYTLDIVSFFSLPYKLTNIQEADLQGSSVTPMHNFGQQFIVKKRIQLSKQYSMSIGGGMGWAMAGYNFVSTPEYSSVDFESPYLYETRRISIDGIEFFSILGEVGYHFPTGKRGYIYIDAGVKATYTRRGSVGLASGTTLNSGQFKYNFYARMIVNNDNLIQFSVDWSPYYLYRFKNSQFGVKGGVSASFSPSKPVRGEVYLYGDRDVFQADTEGGLSFLGLSVGVVYFPKKKADYPKE